MENIQEFLFSYPPHQISFVIGFLVMATSTSLFPSNNDLNMVVAGSLAALGHGNIVLTTIFASIGMIIGESLVFLVGQYFGIKIYNLPFVKKLMPPERYNRIGKMVVRIPLRLILSIRFTPIIRPITYLAFGSFRPGYKLFIKYHAPVAILYCTFVITISYFLSTLITTFINDYKEWVFAALLLVWLLIIKELSRAIRKEAHLETGA